MYDIYGKNITDLSLFELNTRANEELYKEFYRRNNASFYWGPEPNYRGSWTILKSTIFTIVLVLWRLVNVDVYPTATTRQRATYKAIWLVSAIISPATVSLYARRQLLEARDIQKYSSENVLGGRALELEDGTSSGHQHLSTAQSTNGYAPIPKLGNAPHELKINAAFLLISGGFEYDKGGEVSGSIISPLEFKRLLEERRFGEQSEGLAHISEAITEKEKVETFAKVIIALQLCSTMVEGVARECTPLPSTLLEMHISTVLCACVLICVYWWNKPFGITTPVKLKVLGWDRCKQIRGEGNQRKPGDDNDCILGIFRTQMNVLRNPQDIHYLVNVGSWALLCFISWGVFSDIFFFTDIERWVWRVSSSGAASPLLLGLSLIQPSVKNSRFYRILSHFICCLYFLGCMCMFIIALISIRNPPLGAFKVVPWTSYFPRL